MNLSQDIMKLKSFKTVLYTVNVYIHIHVNVQLIISEMVGEKLSNSQCSSHQRLQFKCINSLILDAGLFQVVW